MTESHDPWEDARAAQRADVHRVFAAHPRTCPNCGRVTETSSALCPVCRTPYAVREKDFRITPARAGLVLLVIAVLATIAALTVPGQREDSAAQQRSDAAAQARLEAQERARLREEVRPHRTTGPRRRPGEAPLAYRARLVAAGEAVITEDMRARIAAGEEQGPVRGTVCSPHPKTLTRTEQEADPGVPRNRYQCVAFSDRFPLSELEGRARTGIIGEPYWLVVDYRTGDATFCKITPRAGEGGKSLAVVVVPEPCRDPLL